jgi:hypothetical protein
VKQQDSPKYPCWLKIKIDKRLIRFFDHISDSNEEHGKKYRRINRRITALILKLRSHPVVTGTASGVERSKAVHLKKRTYLAFHSTAVIIL